MLDVASTKEEKYAINRHHNNPVIVNVSPKIIKDIGLEAFVSMNCGRNAMKNKATFGFVILVKNPCTYIFFLFYLLDALA